MGYMFSYRNIVLLCQKCFISFGGTPTAGLITRELTVVASARSLLIEIYRRGVRSGRKGFAVSNSNVIAYQVPGMYTARSVCFFARLGRCRGMRSICFWQES